MLTKNRILFFSLIIMVIIVVITIINLEIYWKHNSDKPEQVVEQMCNFIRLGDKLSLESVIANAPPDFSYRLHIASGGSSLKEEDIELRSTSSPNNQALKGDDLINSVVLATFILNEKVAIKKFLEINQFQNEARVKVLLEQSDFHRERVCTFLLTKYKDKWKVFWIDNGALPKTFKFGRPPSK